MLNPPPNDDDIHASFDKYSWLQDVKSNADTKKLQLEIDRVEKITGAKMDDVSSIYKAFGVEVMLAALAEKQQRVTLAQLPTIYTALTEQLTNVRDEITGVESELAAFNPGTTRLLYFDFIKDLALGVRANIYSQVLLEDFVMDPDEFKQTFEEELQMAHFQKDDAFDGLPTYGELKTQLAASHLLDLKLSGHAATRRLMTVFSFILMNMPLSEIDFLFSWSPGPGVGDVHLTRRVLQRSIRKLNVMMDWLCNHLEYLHQHNFNVASNLLMATTKYSPLKYKSFLHRDLSQAFQNIVEWRSAEIRKQLQTYIFDYAEVVPFDVTSRRLVMMSLAPSDSLAEKLKTNADLFDDKEFDKGENAEAIGALLKDLNILDFLSMGNSFTSPFDHPSGDMDKSNFFERTKRQFNGIEAELYQDIDRTVEAQFRYMYNRYVGDFFQNISLAAMNMSDDDVLLSMGLKDKMQTLRILEQQLLAVSDKIYKFINSTE